MSQERDKICERFSRIVWKDPNQTLEVFLSGVRMALRLERDACQPSNDRGKLRMSTLSTPINSVAHRIPMKIQPAALHEDEFMASRYQPVSSPVLALHSCIKHWTRAVCCSSAGT